MLCALPEGHLHVRAVLTWEEHRRGQDGSQLQSAVNLIANQGHVAAIADFNQDGQGALLRHESPAPSYTAAFLALR